MTPAPALNLSFAPPRTGGSIQALSVAFAAHALLAIGLALSTQWNRQAEPAVFSAEIWANVPAPAVFVPPADAEPPPPPTPPAAAPPPPPPAPAPAPPPLATVDIATSKPPPKPQRPPERSQIDLLRDRAAQQKQAEAKAKAASAAEEARSEARQNEQRLRMLALANQSAPAPAAQAPNASVRVGQPGAATSPSSGPSNTYAGRVVARVRPNIVFTEDPRGNPAAEVEVRTASDGTILSRRLIKASGHALWDEAVLKAIDKTEVLPRDGDRAPPAIMIVVFRPRD